MAVSTNAKVCFFFESKISLSGRTVLKEFIERIFKKEGRPLGSLNIVFCSDKRLLEINNSFLAHDFYTDIITFDLSETKEEVIGEIYISVDRVKDNSKFLKTRISQELKRVVFHGALHLCGYKDKSPKDIKLMRSKEDAYLQLFEIFSR